MKEKELTYEKAIARLEEIIAKLENSDITLEESLKLYEEAMHLSSFCTKLLNDTEKTVITLSGEIGEDSAAIKLTE